MKNIDKIFNDSLKNYERQPRTEAWEKLQAKLEKRDNKIVPLWWRYASAASVALLLGVGGYWFASQKETETEVVAISKNPVLKKEVEVRKEIDLQKNELVKVDNQKIQQKLRYSVQSEKIVDKPMVVEVIKLIEHQKEDIKIIAQIPKIENKPIVEENTIVLVLENTKPKKEEETIVLNFVDTKVETVAQNIEPEKKQSRVGKIWEQLKRAKNGEGVEWNRLGVKPQKVLARADAKIENVLTRGESNDR